MQNNRLLPPISQILKDNAPAFTQAQSYYSSAPTTHASMIAPGDLEDAPGSLVETLGGNNTSGYMGTGARSSSSAESSNSIGDDGYFANRGSVSGSGSYSEGMIGSSGTGKKANYNALGLGVSLRGHKLTRNGFGAPAPLTITGHMSSFETVAPFGDSTALNISSFGSSGLCSMHDIMTFLVSPDDFHEDSGVPMDFIRDVLTTAPDSLGTTSFGGVNPNLGFGIDLGLGLCLDGNGGDGVSGVDMSAGRSGGSALDEFVPPMFASVLQAPVSMAALGTDLDSGENYLSPLP